MSLDNEIKKIAQKRENDLLAQQSREEARLLEEENRRKVDLQHEKNAWHVAKTIVLPLLKKINRSARLKGTVGIDGMNYTPLAEIFSRNRNPTTTIECVLIWDEEFEWVRYGSRRKHWQEIRITLSKSKFGNISLTDPSLRKEIEQYILEHLKDETKTFHSSYGSLDDQM